MLINNIKIAETHFIIIEGIYFRVQTKNDDGTIGHFTTRNTYVHQRIVRFIHQRTTIAMVLL